MAERTLTSANSVLMLSIVGLYDSPVQIQGYATDAVSDTDAINPAETMMGVDGVFSGGWIPVPIAQNYNLQGDSASIDIFETWYQSNQQRKELFIANGSMLVRSVGKRYTMTRGFLTNYTPTALLAKTVQPRKFTITWGKVTWAAY